MIYRAYMTGERHTSESLECGDAAERGWVDPNWSMTDLQEARNYVRPAAEYNPLDPEDVEDYPTVAAWIAATVAEHLGAAEDNGDGTWYGVDAQTHDYTTDDTYTYSLHFHVKRHTSSRGWVEDDVTADGSLVH
jgi:hypothetical protein